MSNSIAIESFNNQPLPDVLPSYLYFQYQDDDDLQAFVSSYNEIAQGYVDWFNSTPLGVYTSTSISGQLLDWVANGIYGISRPFLSSVSSRVYGATNTKATNTLPTNNFDKVQSGTSQNVTDDIYKRVLTWHLYRGDGYQTTIHWLKKRVSRFIYGLNGSDINIDYIYNISVNTPPYANSGALNTVAMNTVAMNGFHTNAYEVKHALEIRVPNNSSGMTFQTLFNEGYLPMPFQINFTVILV